MSQSNASLAPAESRLHEGWLLIARGIWLLLAGGLFVSFIVGVQGYDAQLRTVCTSDSADCGFNWLPTPANVQALHQMRLSVHAYAAAFIAFAVLVSLVFLLVGGLLFWHKSHEWYGLFVSLLLVMFGCFGFTNVLQPTDLSSFPAAFQAFISVMSLAQYIGLAVFLLTFPTGRFAPRWSWALVLLWVAQAAGFAAPSPYGFANWPGWLDGVDILVVWGSTVAVQVYRYRKLYTPVQRQQTKWVVFGVAAGFLIVVLSSILGGVIPDLSAPNSPYQLLNGFFIGILFLSIPLSVGIAIMRYRLWDIDTIINKALVYGVLTALLGALYVGLILGLTALAGAITGPAAQEPVALVISTLAIAALFLPVRRRIQAIIDRRFYRHKYDAEKTLAAFSATLRSEVDLEQVREQLLAVVQETMQPAQVSLWLRASRAVADASQHCPSSSWSGLPWVCSSIPFPMGALFPVGPGYWLCCLWFSLASTICPIPIIMTTGRCWRSPSRRRLSMAARWAPSSIATYSSPRLRSASRSNGWPSALPGRCWCWAPFIASCRCFFQR